MGQTIDSIGLNPKGYKSNSESIILYRVREFESHLRKSILEMEIQQQKSPVLLTNNVSKIIYSQSKFKIPVPPFSNNINKYSYNKQLVWNRFALLTAAR